MPDSGFWANILKNLLWESRKGLFMEENGLNDVPQDVNGNKWDFQYKQDF